MKHHLDILIYNVGNININLEILFDLFIVLVEEKLKNCKDILIPNYCFNIDKIDCSYGLIEIIESIIEDYNELSHDLIEIVI